MFERNICRDWITNRILTKFVQLKIDNGGDTVMSCDAIYIISHLCCGSNHIVCVKVRHALYYNYRELFVLAEEEEGLRCVVEDGHVVFVSVKTAQKILKSLSA